MIYDGARLEHSSLFKKEVNIIRSSSPVCSSSTLDYFEVTIENGGETGEIAIGLASADLEIDTENMPGFSFQTIGYHQDGQVYPGVNDSKRLDKFGTGDTIGCKITRMDVNSASFQRVQFTKNGEKIDAAGYLGIGNYYPTIGMKSKEAAIIANIGHESFSYMPAGRYS